MRRILYGLGMYLLLSVLFFLWYQGTDRFQLQTPTTSVMGAKVDFAVTYSNPSAPFGRLVADKVVESGLPQVQGRVLDLTTTTTSKTVQTLVANPVSSRTNILAANSGNYTLFKCGYPRPRLRKFLFPEITTEAVPYTRKSVVHEQDILLFAMHGPCDGTLRNKIAPDFVEQHFTGKALFVNGEPFGNVLTDYGDSHNHLYQAGPPVDDSHSHTMRLFHAAVVLVTLCPREQWDWIFNHASKPKNNQKYSAVMYMSSNCVDFRQHAASQLSDIIEIHFGGGCQVPTKDAWNGKKVRHGRRDKRYENFNVFSEYKYCLVMENTQAKGYITEKLIFGYLGGCLPIYYGTVEVFEIFNPQSFIFFDINNPTLALEEIEYLQRNDTAYKERMDAPILRNGAQTVDEFFSLSDSVGNGSLKRRIRTKLGLPP